MNSVPDAMVLSSDLETRRQLRKILDSNGIDPVCLSSIRDCRELLAERGIDLIFCDSELTDGTYRDLLQTAARGDRKIRVVVTSRQSGWEEFLEAARLGAFDMITTPCVPTEVEWVLSQVVRARRTEREAAALASRVPEMQLHSLPRARMQIAEELFIDLDQEVNRNLR